MPTLRGRIWDKATGRPLEARVSVQQSTGLYCSPPDAPLKVGPGQPFFYCEGSFGVDVLLGQTDVVVERGTEYRPLRLTLTLPASGPVDLDLPLERWISLPEQGWYAGNTHVHYSEVELRPLDRLLVHLFLSHDLSLLSCSLCNTPFYSITSSWTGLLPPLSQKSLFVFPTPPQRRERA